MPESITGLDASDRAILERVIREVLGRVVPRTTIKRRVFEELPYYWCKLTSNMVGGAPDDPEIVTVDFYFPAPGDMSDHPDLVVSTDADYLDVEIANRTDATGTADAELQRTTRRWWCGESGAFERAEILMKDQAISRQDYDQRRATRMA